MSRLFLVGMVICFLLAGGCNKDEENGQVIKHHLRVKSGALLEFKIGNTPTEGFRQIIKHPDHYLISELIFSSTYRYQSEEGFRGREQVVIESKESAGGQEFSILNTFKLVIDVD